VGVPCPALDEDQGVTLIARWGEELDVRLITTDDGGELSAEQVAGYVAKYATKATEALGVTLDHRLGEGDLEDLDLPAHVAELVRACWDLGARPTLTRLQLRRWAHMLGFGGHFSTKSRRYSTTLGALRRARATYAIRRRRGDILPLDAWGRPEDDQAVIAVASWAYLGSGYQTTGEAWLAASAAARAREARRIAKEELHTTTIAA
jgi:replication initiator protein RepSA